MRRCYENDAQLLDPLLGEQGSHKKSLAEVDYSTRAWEKICSSLRPTASPNNATQRDHNDRVTIAAMRPAQERARVLFRWIGPRTTAKAVLMFGKTSVPRTRRCALCCLRKVEPSKWLHKVQFCSYDAGSRSCD